MTCESLCLVTCSVLIVGGTDTIRRTGPQLVLFSVPHFRELRPESLKVIGMGLRGVVVWLVSTVLVWFSGAATGPFVRGCKTER
ncbi:hypothetical protein Taro_006794 [Colocasia esculenta]|uniref:Uncharacterized protein n=1 Tax=Colocasia esculenta TaxID=4460 RepID=A0A843TYF1_COLES|nr:hypothetical protein [Colocasia esculenta]